MHDLKSLRDNPAAFDTNWARRGLSPQTPAILALDEKRRKLQTELQVAQSRRNEASKEIGSVKSKGGDAAALMAEVATLKETMATLEVQEKEIADELTGILSALPNMKEIAIRFGIVIVVAYVMLLGAMVYYQRSLMADKSDFHFMVLCQPLFHLSMANVMRVGISWKRAKI